VFWWGKNYTFTINQAACVKVLWEARNSKTQSLSQSDILDKAKISQERLDKVFKGNEAWKEMIVSSKKGMYCLAVPENTP
jgi:hypothetical protein